MRRNGFMDVDDHRGKLELPRGHKQVLGANIRVASLHLPREYPSINVENNLAIGLYRYRYRTHLSVCHADTDNRFITCHYRYEVEGITQSAAETILLYQLLIISFQFFFLTDTKTKIWSACQPFSKESLFLIVFGSNVEIYQPRKKGAKKVIFWRRPFFRPFPGGPNCFSLVRTKNWTRCGTFVPFRSAYTLLHLIRFDWTV